MANSINTNNAAFSAQANISRASNNANTSVSRLSSGNFITKASDDVARLSIGTSFSTTVRTLKQALVNASQGSSLLQVADGGLGQITEILQRQKTLATQASSGNLSDNDRQFLNQEFQALKDQIDFISKTSSFNGVNLLNGSLASSSRIEDSIVKSANASATIQISEANNLINGDAIVINGLTFTARTSATISSNAATARQEFLIGTTSADTAANLAAKLTTLSSSNAATVSVPTETYAQRLGQNTYTNIAGSATLTVTARTGGTLGERFIINASGVASNKVSVGGNFGGASVNVFSAGVSTLTSATNSVVSASPTATVPFKSGDVLTLKLGTSAPVSLYTLQAGNSLTDIVKGINTTSLSTGVSASLIGDSTSGYNIKLSLSNVSSTASVAVGAGSGFFKPASGVAVIQTTQATSTVSLFNSTFAASIANAADIISATSPSTTDAPLKTGDNLYVSVDGGNYLAIAAIGAGETTQGLVDKINANANAVSLGIRAELNALGNNIRLTYSDTTQTGGISFYAGTAGGSSIPTGSTTFATDATGQFQSGPFGGTFTSFNLLGTSVTAPDLSLTDASATPTFPTPFRTTAGGGNSVISLSINTSSTASQTLTYTVTDGTTLQGLAGIINSDPTSAARGIRASVVADGSGYNLKITLATSAAVPVAATTGNVNAVTSGIRISATNSALATVNTTGTLNNTNAVPLSYSRVNLFGQGLTNAVTGSSDISAANIGAATAASPLAAGTNFVLSFPAVGSNAAFNITIATAANQTIDALVASINADANAVANGITAVFVGAGTANANIELRFADTNNTGVASPLTLTTNTGVGVLAGSAQAAATTTFVPPAGSTQTSYRLFNSQFAASLASTAGQPVVAVDLATSSASSPFVNGQVLRVAIGGTTNINLATLATGDTLGDIVSKINANTLATGFSAALDGNGTNIILSRDASIANANADTEVTAGSRAFFSVDSAIKNDLTVGDLTTGAGVSARANLFNNNYNTVNAFSTNFTAANSAAALALQLGGSTTLTASPDTINATKPFNHSLTLTADGGANNVTNYNVTSTFDITIRAGVVISGLTVASSITATMNGAGNAFTSVIRNASGTNTTLGDLITQINNNATARANGVRAELVDTGGGTFNIGLVVTDAQNAGIQLVDPRAISARTENIATVNVGPSTSPATGPVAAAGTDNTASFADATYTLGTVTDHRLTRANTYAKTTSVNAQISALQANIGLRGGSNTGIGYGSTSVSGAVSSALVTGLANKSASVSVSFADTDASAVAGAFTGKTLNIAGTTFTFATTAASSTEIKIGATLQETIDNVVSALNRYTAEKASGDALYQLKQVDFARSGNNLVITGKGINNVSKLDGTVASTISTNVASSVVSNSGLLNNSSRTGTGTFGIDVNGVTNADFRGKLQGFTAVSTAADTVTLSVKVGDNTYTATGVNTNPIIGGAGVDALGNQTIRFYSDTVTDANGRQVSGGFFDVQLAANQGRNVANQAEANIYAAQVNAAFQGLSFNQTRAISSFKAEGAIINSAGTSIGSLVGASVSAQLPSFESNKLTTVSVNAPSAGAVDSEVSLTIDGVAYTSRGIGTKLGANQTYTLFKAGDSSAFVKFTTGNDAIDLSTDSNAVAFENALKTAFGVSDDSAALSFQIGTTSTESLGVNIAEASTDALYNGQSLSILTIEGAAKASAAIDVALQTVTSIRAGVGALQSRFNFASANIQISVQNQDASRSELLDTDIAAESTDYATAQVKLQAGISVLAQANQQLQALLKLIG